jgi:hypothetical protein
LRFEEGGRRNERQQQDNSLRTSLSSFACVDVSCAPGEIEHVFNFFIANESLSGSSSSTIVMGNATFRMGQQKTVEERRDL